VTTLRTKNIEARTEHGTWKRGKCYNNVSDLFFLAVIAMFSMISSVESRLKALD